MPCVKIPASQLDTSLKKSLLPCYLVSGDEPLLAQEALDAIRGRARQSGFDARDLHVASTGFDWGELRNQGGNLSLFAEKRIIELRLPTGKPGKAGGTAIVDLVRQAGDDLLVLIAAPKLDKSSLSTAWVKAIQSGGALVQVWPVDLRELPVWIVTRMRRVGLQPAPEAATMIADRVEGNLLAAVQEIEKLRLLRGEGPIGVADVDDAVADSARFDVYKLVDAAVAGDATRALRILGGVRDDGTEIVIVMWALTRELRTLARLAENIRSGVELSSALRSAGVWRNRQDIVRACVSRHQPTHFFSLLKLANEGDAAAKGRLALDAWQIAAEIVVGLARADRRAA